MSKIEQGTRKSMRQRVTAYRNRRGDIIRAGNTVQLNQKAFKTFSKEQEQFAGTWITKALVKSVFNDIKGFVLLEQRLGGYWTWDVNDLEKIKET